MIPTFTYEQAVLLSRIKPKDDSNVHLCLDYECTACPAYTGTKDCNQCQFVVPYISGYNTATGLVRSDMKAQFSPEQYPELYI